MDFPARFRGETTDEGEEMAVRIVGAVHEPPGQADLKILRKKNL
jgi:hypothetical protein